MVGLSVLLESQKNGMFLNRRRWMTASSTTSPPQIVNQTAMIRPSFSSASGFVIGEETTAFLHQCFLCKRRLLENEDIYMYLGEMAFCSEDCRFEHMRTEADDGQGAGESNNGRSDQKSSTSSPDSMRKPVVKHPVFSADCSPPKHEEKSCNKKRTNSRIAC